MAPTRRADACYCQQRRKDLNINGVCMIFNILSDDVELTLTPPAQHFNRTQTFINTLRYSWFTRILIKCSTADVNAPGRSSMIYKSCGYQTKRRHVISGVMLFTQAHVHWCVYNYIHIHIVKMHKVPRVESCTCFLSTCHSSG